MIIDSNIYWLPDQLFTSRNVANKFIRTVPRAYGVYAHQKITADGKREFLIEKPEGYENLNYFQGDYDLASQLKDMDDANIDLAILKLPGCQEWLDLDLCIQFNDEMAERVKESDGRMRALAVVPPSGDESTLNELDRCINELHMSGVQLSAHYGHKYLDDPMFRPLLKHINKLNVPVYVHHTPVPVDYNAISEYNNLRRSYGRCVDQTIAISRELFSGMFADLPNLKMIHSMLGGGFFTYAAMLFPKKSGNGRFDASNEAVENYLKDNIYFEMSHAQPWGKAQLQCAVDVLGADHIIYGSSYPVKKDWLTGGPAFVNQLAVNQEKKDLMLYKNAQRLYGLDVVGES